MSRFSGKNIIITGAAKGIGKAIAEKFVAEGGAVGLIDMGEDAGKNVASEFVEKGAKACFLPLDITDSKAVVAVVEALKKELGSVDILINCAGAAKGESLKETDVETWRWNIEVNLIGAYAVTHAALPFLLANRASAIVNISSVNALMTVGVPAYSAAKAGLLAMTRSFATEYAKEGLRSNAVLPGTIQTTAWDDRIERIPDVIEKVSAWYPGGEVGQPEDVAGAVCFLASSEARFINGASLVVDGGLTIGNHRLIDEFS
ncbi:MAG: SDR family oxidoreductase [Emcibacter sp.]|nr:SDR family oxidoreductase [Emcibacter sp.]